MYLIRLDDAAEYMNIDKWNQMEELLKKYEIKPLVGVIPHNEDISLKKYSKVNDFWKKVQTWHSNEWTICMHGYNHVYITKEGGINPVNNRSEFAGVEYKEQEEKIIKANKIFKENNIDVEVFFAPSHTFDLNTLKAIKNNTKISIISDTYANDVYYENDFYFIPQQSGKARKLPFKITTFCFHPNEMQENEFNELENFLKNNKSKIGDFTKVILRKRKRNIYDKFLNFIYFSIKKARNKVRKK